MKPEDVKAELAAAYAEIEKREAEIKRQKRNIKELDFTLDLLQAGGFIADGKLEEARGFAQTYLD